MKKLITILASLSILTAGCKGQVKNSGKAEKMNSIDTTSQPKIDVKVNKKYDKKGNLIQYDSTYSYFYASPGLKSKAISSDSIFGRFKDPLHDNFRQMFEKNMNNLFFNDSLFKYDFYNKDYFSKRFHMNWDAFEKMFGQMDSLKSGMFKHDFPEGQIKKK